LFGDHCVLVTGFPQGQNQRSKRREFDFWLTTNRSA
jgi:hypothetical protein